MAQKKDIGFTATQVRVGISRTALLKNTFKSPKREEFNVSVLVIIPLEQKFNVQFQYIDNFRGTKLIRTGVSFNATSLIKKIF